MMWVKEEEEEEEEEARTSDTPHRSRYQISKYFKVHLRTRNRWASQASRCQARRRSRR